MARLETDVALDALPAGIIVPTSCIATVPGRGFTRFLLRQGMLVNYVGLCERDDWRGEGRSIRAGVEEVLVEYAGCYEDVGTLIRRAPPEGRVKAVLFGREPLERRSVGRVALLGDAARNHHSGRVEKFQPGRHVSAESLGIMACNPVAVAV